MDSIDLNRARKAELIAFAEERGWNTEGTVLELRARIKMSLESKDAVEESEGAVAEMFPELEELSDEDVDKAIDTGRRKESIEKNEVGEMDKKLLEAVAEVLVPLEDIPDEPEDLKKIECPQGFHWSSEAEKCVENDSKAESIEETEIPDIPHAEDDEFTEEMAKVHTPLEPCKNCGTDLERFPPFLDPDSDASRCPNCGHGL